MMSTSPLYHSEETIAFASGSLSRHYGASGGLNLENDPGIEEKMRSRLKWHYMNAYEKYKAGGRKPWKLLVQIIKIFFVTAQVMWFADLRFSVIQFLDETHQVFQHLFFLNPNVSSGALYTRNDLFSQIHFTTFQYENINDISLGAYGYTCGNNSSRCPIKMCVHKYNNSKINPSTLYYDIPNRPPGKFCRNITTIPNASMSEFVEKNDIPRDFHGVLAVDLNMSLRTIKIEQLRFGNSPQCIQFNLRLKFKDNFLTGKLKAHLHTVQTYMDCNTSMPDTFHVAEIIYDVVVILICSWSFVLTTRSIIRNFKLAVLTFRFFKVHKNETLSVLSDGTELLNIWFVIIILTDILTIVGCVIKIYIDTANLKETYFYDTCSLCLGISVLFIWIGILRYVGFSRKYNILLITLEASLPSVLRFLCCGGILYFGFLFCGWICFGPYHQKFSTLSEVSECLFSLINGDDMFMTFREMPTNNYELWIFSKVYLYLFISLFIYVVLSLFIGIISDTYERLQSGEHVLCSNVKRFIHGPECPCHARSEMITSNDVRHDHPSHFDSR